MADTPMPRDPADELNQAQSNSEPVPSSNPEDEKVDAAEPGSHEGSEQAVAQSAVAQPAGAQGSKRDAPGETEPFTLAAPLAPAPAPEAKRVARKEPEEASLSPYVITVGQVYDGPMDLLLDLIRKQNIDIYDIPIGRITAQFLEYTRHLRQTDVDAAGEFIYTRLRC